MAINKQNIKNKFRQPQALPDEFSWDSMKDGINEKMAKAAPIAPKYSIGKKPMYFVFSAIIVCILGYWVSRSQDSNLPMMTSLPDEKQSAETPSLNSAPDPSSKESMDAFHNNESSIPSDKIHSLTSNVSIKDNNTSSKQPIADSGILSSSKDGQSVKINSRNLSPTKTAPSSLIVKDEAVNSKSEKGIAKENLESKIELPQVEVMKANNILSGKNTNDLVEASVDNQVSKESIIENTNTGDQSKATSDISFDNDDFKNKSKLESPISNTSKIERTLESINRLPVIAVQLSRNEVLESYMKLQTTSKAIRPNKSVNSNSIYVYTGFNKGVSSFANDAIGMLKSATHTDKFGYSIGLGWISRLHQNFHIDMGVNYYEVNDVFDYKSAPVRYEVYKQNAVLGIKFDANTGDTIVIRGEGIERGSKSRVVHWLNVNKLYNVPILLNYEYRVSKLGIGAGVGPVLSYSTSYSGKSIEGADSIAVLGNDYLTKWAFGAKGQVYLSYDIVDNISIGIRANMTMPFNSITTSTYSSIRRYTWGSGLYVAYRF